MNRQRIGPQHVDGPSSVVDGQRRPAVLGNQLACSDVGDNHGARRLLADNGIRVRQVRVAQRGSLAAHAHGQTMTLCRPGQNCVDLEGRGVPASHRGEHERRVHALAEQRLAQIDLVEIELGQGFVDQVHVIPAGSDARVDVGGRADPQVFGLPSLDRILHAQPILN